MITSQHIQFAVDRKARQNAPPLHLGYQHQRSHVARFSDSLVSHCTDMPGAWGHTCIHPATRCCGPEVLHFKSTAVEPAITESSISRRRNRLSGRNSSKTPAQVADQVVSEVVRVWERECVACRVQGYRSRQEHAHAWRDCTADFEINNSIDLGTRFLSIMRGPLRRQGFRCWAGGEGCCCLEEGKRGSCSGSEVVRLVVAALLFAGGKGVQKWVEGQEAFTKSIEKGTDELRPR